MTNIELRVPEIHCDHCKSSIEAAVGTISGVEKVDVVVGDRSVAISYDGSEGTLADVVQAIGDQGYSVSS